MVKSIKLTYKYVLLFLGIFATCIILQFNSKPYIYFDIKSEPNNPNGVIQLFYAELSDDFSEERVITQKLSLIPLSERYKFHFQDEELTKIKYLRLDPCNCEGTFVITSWGLDRGLATSFLIPVVGGDKSLTYLYPAHQVVFDDGVFASSGFDPQIKTLSIDFEQTYKEGFTFNDFLSSLGASLFFFTFILVTIYFRKFLKVRTLKLLIFTFPILYTVIIIFGLIKDWSFVGAFNRFEGPGEVLQAQLFLASSLVAIMIYTKLRKSNNLLKFFHLLLAISFLIIMLEEISYGQRIFQLTTPEALAAINLQNEVTLHNIAGPIHGHDLFKIIGVYGTLSWLLGKVKILQRLELISFIIIPKVASLYFFSVFLFFFLFDLGDFRYGVIPQIPNVQEAFELLLSLGFLIYIIRNFNLIFKIEIIEKNPANSIA
jgi:hypothetical protein